MSELTWEGIAEQTYARTVEQYAELPDFFRTMALAPPREDDHRPLREVFAALDETFLRDMGIAKADLPAQAVLFLRMMQERGQHFEVRSVTILGGTDKSGQPEDVRIALEAGQVISVVGPTGSGKSRLLADIEWMAQADTPTGRRIFINGEPPPPEWRYALEHKLVAQLSQNMNFVMDLSVERFIAMHGQSRRTEDIEQKQSQILQAANALAGEPLSGDTPLTALSGGQSRALMIADTAFLSVSPIVLIDEIENAGIDRQQAVNLLIRAGKIVVIATHDPMLALTAERRLVISNGGIVRILETSEEEQACLVALERMNRKMNQCRERLRNGQTVSLADLR